MFGKRKILFKIIIYTMIFAMLLSSFIIFLEVLSLT